MRYEMLLLMVFVVVLGFGCADKAKPNYDQCVRYAENNLSEKAAEACKAAIAADPNSESGKLLAFG